MTESTTEELLALYDYVHGRLVGMLNGLSDEAYLWEPVPGCWSVRRGKDGVFRAGRTYPDPEPAPVTTIAWRVWHIGGDCLLSYSDRFFEGRDVVTPQWPGTVAEASAELEKQWSRFRAHVAGIDDEGLARPLGPVAGPYASDSYHSLILHALDEVIHHTAEIGVLRDLHRASGGGTAWAQA